LISRCRLDAGDIDILDEALGHFLYPVNAWLELFYTRANGAGASSPAIYGLFDDELGIRVAMSMIAALVLITLPLA
jgi:hypothetical protein